MKPGRKSGASLATVTVLPGLQRITPPDDLTPEQGEVWRAVVASKPAEWFEGDSQPILKAYCKTVSEHARVSVALDAFDPEWLKTDDGLKRYDTLTKLQDRHARLMTTLATKMRLTQQSRYRADAADVANSKAGLRRPWEFQGN